MITMSVMRALGDALFQRREQLGMTQRQFGDAIGKDPAWVSRLERGQLKETPPPEVLRAIRQTLGLSEASMLAMVGYAVGEPAAEDDPIRVPMDDPRARVLAALDGLPDHVVDQWAVSIAAITNATTHNTKRDVSSSGNTPHKPNTA